jgi:hypothetical protein
MWTKLILKSCLARKIFTLFQAAQTEENNTAVRTPTLGVFSYYFFLLTGKNLGKINRNCGKKNRQNAI